MSIFANDLDHISGADLERLRADGAVENVLLEFKREAPGKDELLKKLSSFANTHGGYLIVGAQENGKGHLIALPGVDPEKGFKQRVVSWCADGASPPLSVEVSGPIDVGVAGKACYVVYTPESDLAPHFLSGRAGLYIRTSEFSMRFEARLADERDVRSLLDRRRQVTDRRDYVLSRFRQRFKRLCKNHSAVDGRPILEIAIIPRYPHRQLIKEHDLVATIGSKKTRLRGGNFPGMRAATTHHESLLWQNFYGQMTSLLEANIWGLVAAGFVFPDVEGQTGIHPGLLVGLIDLVVVHAATLLATLAYTGPLLIKVRLHAFSAWLNSLKKMEVFPILDEDVALSIESSLPGLSKSRDAAVIELVRQVYFAASQPNSTDESFIRQQIASGRGLVGL